MEEQGPAGGADRQVAKFVEDDEIGVGEGRRQFGEWRAIAQGSRLALNDRQIVPPVVNRCGALPFVRAGEDATMSAADRRLYRPRGRFRQGTSRHVRLQDGKPVGRYDTFGQTAARAMLRPICLLWQR
jgi:hypothetical protein